MKLKITWEKPVPLIKAKDHEELIYLVNEKKILNVPGIYIFARHYGKCYEALYVGKSTNLRNRVRGHMNNLKLMKYLEHAKTGKRVVIIGRAVPLPGQMLNNILPALERTFIRHFLVPCFFHQLHKFGSTVPYIFA